MELKHNFPRAERDLATELAEALKSYKSGDPERRRQGAIGALKALIDDAISRGIPVNLLRPAHETVAKLNDLNNGIPDPMFAPTHNGRPPFSIKEELAQEAVAAALEVLIDSRIGRDRAKRKVKTKVETEFTRRGIKGHHFQSTHADTIVNWRTKVRKKSKAEAPVYWVRLEEWGEAKRLFRENKEEAVRPATLEGLGERFVDMRLIPDLVHYLELDRQKLEPNE
jgi:hypothetical protein